jgi:predicted CxxxxCH...CXXCH cytochrome family protein
VSHPRGRPRALLPAVAAALLLAGRAAAQVCDPATSGIGAHPSHTKAGFARDALACTECHPAVCSPEQTTPIAFGALASARGALPSWDPATRTCSGVYCHGATLKAPPATPPSWTYVDPALVRPNSVQCLLCHGYPPPSHSASSTSCQGCHAPTVRSDGTIDVAGGRHVNGSLDFSGGGSGFACDACHAFPPADPAHVAHFGLAGAASTGQYGDLRVLQDRYPGETPTSAPAAYAFGCGLCHPIDSGRHMDGSVEVALYEAGAAAGSLKLRNAPTAAYDPATGTCSGVYCHSTGQATPTYAATPGWTSGQHLGCGGCHANPPAYPSGGAGSATANSHLDLADDGYEFGHFLGLMGPWHTSQHGGNYGAADDAAPITCQTCHFDTTDPASTGPSGFYWLDTTGDYALAGNVDPAWLAQQQCNACHGPGGAATGAGKVLPLRHVNGARDVAFDPRTALPAIAWLPPSPGTPTGPYWMTSASSSMPWPSSVHWNGSTVSFDLAGSSYDRATKTCSNVACHLAEAPVWGRPYQYYTNSSATCYLCHPM